MLKSEKIIKLDELEEKKLWKSALEYCIDNWKTEKSYYFSFRFCFLCWHIYVYNHDMDFKKIMKIKDKDLITEVIFDGVKLTKMYEYVNLISDYIIKNCLKESDYILNTLFAHIILAQPYAFEKIKETFAKKLILEAYQADSNNPIIKTYYNRMNNNWAKLNLTPDNEIFIKKYFNSNSLFDKYFLTSIL